MAISTIHTQSKFKRIEAETIALLHDNSAFLIADLHDTLDDFYRLVAADPEAQKTARAIAEISERIIAIPASTNQVSENIDLIARTTDEASIATNGIATAVEQQSAETQEISRNITEALQSVAKVLMSVQAVLKSAEASSALSGEVLNASD